MRCLSALTFCLLRFQHPPTCVCTVLWKPPVSQKNCGTMHFISFVSYLNRSNTLCINYSLEHPSKEQSFLSWHAHDSIVQCMYDKCVCVCERRNRGKRMKLLFTLPNNNNGTHNAPTTIRNNQTNTKDTILNTIPTI